MSAMEFGATSKGGVRRRLAYVALGWGLVAMMAGGYLWFVRKNCSPYASSADAASYLNWTRVVYAGQPLRSPVPRIEGLSPPGWNYSYQTPLGYIVFPNDGTYAPMPSIGYPLHLLVASTMVGVGWAAVAVSVFVVAGVGALMVVLGRRFGLPWAWALAGVALMWAAPVFVYISLQPMSDIPAALWCLAAIAAAFRARDRWQWGFATGGAMAIAVLVRPTNTVMIFPIAVVLGLRWRAWLALIAGGIPGAGFLLGYNVHLYGRSLATGYGDMSWAFGAKFILPNLRHYAVEIPRLLSPLVAGFALGLPWLWRRIPLVVAVLGVWFAAFAGFYSYCILTGMAWSMRYLMPAYPALILAALLVMHELAGSLKGRGWRRAIPIGALALALFWDVAAGRMLHVVIMKRGESMYVETVDWMRTHVPANAIVVGMQATGALTYYANFPLVRYDLTPVDALERVYAAARTNGQDVFAVLFDPERDAAFRDKLKGEWTPVGRVRSFGIWKRTEPAHR